CDMSLRSAMSCPQRSNYRAASRPLPAISLPGHPLIDAAAAGHNWPLVQYDPRRGACVPDLVAEASGAFDDAADLLHLPRLFGRRCSGLGFFRRPDLGDQLLDAGTALTAGHRALLDRRGHRDVFG